MSGWWGVLYGVTLPLIAPAVLFSFLLVFILSFGEVSVANFLRYDLFALESFTYFSAFYDTRSATLLALPMVLLSGVFLFLIRGVLNQPFSLVSSATPRVMMEHRYVRYFALCVMILFVFIFLLFPLSSLFIKAFEAGVWSETIRDFWGSMLRSMLFASLVATFMMVLGFVGAIFIKERYRGAVWYENVLFFIFVLPLGVVGIAFILFWNHKVTNFIYQTPLIIILALVLKYLFLSTKTIQYHLSHIPKSMDESAQLLGASYAQRIGAIYLPMSKGVLMLSWLIGFIFSLRETSMTMLLTPAGMATLPVSTLTQMANGNPDTIATLLVIMIGMVLLAMLVVWGIWRKIR
jgi:iron(III) transport system permease protein